MSGNAWKWSHFAVGAIAALGLPAAEAPVPETPKDHTFKLGETVVVSAKLDPIETVNTRVQGEEIQAFNRDTVASALALVPGVNVGVTGNRNEQTVLVRGNDSRQVPVFLDGIPVYLPYDGSIDYARFTTFDLSEIQVEKGFSSVAYGPNTLGGAINLVTRRPGERFEGDLRLGVFEGNGRKAALNLGSNQGRWYAQLGASLAQADAWRMSSHFVPTRLEDGGKRENSDFSDKKISFKAGFTPNDRDEYAVGIVQQKGEKGNPVTTDPGSNIRYWRWPTWDKKSVYFISTTGLGDQSALKLRAYYDTYRNSIYNYTNATYSTLLINPKSWPTGKSYYDDFTHGVMAEVDTELVPSHSLKAVLQTKTDVHREGDGSLAGTDRWLNYEDQLFTAGLEDSITLGEKLDLSAGVGWDRLKPVHSGPTWALPAPQSHFHGQLGLFWKAAPRVQIYATIAQKDRFPTLKDRYSSKFATHVVNPDLKSELSTNYEIGMKAAREDWLQVDAALFLSDIRNLIQDIDTGLPLPAPQTGDWMQLQNIGKVQHSGLEVAVGLKPNAHFQGGIAYTYLDRTNKSNPSVPLLYTPKNRLSGYLKTSPTAKVFILASVQGQDGIWDNGTTKYARLGGFTTVDLSVGWEPVARLQFDGGCTNLLDRNYQVNAGYPMPGRMGFLNARYKF